ncbi:methylglutaconyl-CoA hydratase, mitochondrial-like [Trichogramma pretiosum]|uniref:methylglutaconyl-CoA hydratase, mitochondrial-like n=1 Tax=Trichogramma pretiosum TaxID=7493 RepID=UPI0006C9A991|nr:methylglutaconyl-CoA hydratase, mitochondrial-like [Trichogramma pretiosum]XP_014234822.1 methylglutaconyl-CoA hydratase, mitochondrial-like [Trichogramma pretiosum]
MALIIRPARFLSNFAFRALSTQTQTKIRQSEDRQSQQQQQQQREVVLKYLDGKDNGIVVLGLNRPESRNAFGRRLVDQLTEAIEHVKKDDKVRVLVLRSLVPKCFCAGADLRERSHMQPQEVASFVSSLRSLFHRIEVIKAPVISAIDGVALGGGLEMALACDLRTAAADAKMGLVETKLAIIPGAGGTQRLPRLIGPSLAKELIYTARIFDGAEAHRLGLINRLVDQNRQGDAAYQEALTLAREILPNGPIGVRMAKEAINRGTEAPIDEALEIEKECYSRLLDTEDRLEGLAAFASKRAPVYRGV